MRALERAADKAVMEGPMGWSLARVVDRAPASAVEGTTMFTVTPALPLAGEPVELARFTGGAFSLPVVERVRARRRWWWWGDRGRRREWEWGGEEGRPPGTAAAARTARLLVMMVVLL